MNKITGCLTDLAGFLDSMNSLSCEVTMVTYILFLSLLSPG